MGLNGKRVVILGGTSGIGLATAKAAQGQGAAVVVASSRSQRVESALAALQGKAAGEVVDLADESQVRALFERIGPFDHFVYSAGETLHLETLEKMQIDQARGFANLRFWGAFMAAKYGSPHIRPGGSITLTTGLAARRPHKRLDGSREHLRGDGSAHQGASGGARADPGERGLPRRGSDGALERHERVRSRGNVSRHRAETAGRSLRRGR